ncbi:MAG: ABC transporter substrate-binding protein, partial [Bacteroidota bacterium]
MTGSSSGAYKVENWSTGDNITLVRKEDWWGDQLHGQQWSFQGWADKIIFKTITDRVTAIRAAAAGEIDVIRDLPGDEFLKIREDKDGEIMKNFNLHTPDTYSYVYLGLNCRPPAGRTPFLEDPRVRKALAHITDVDRIIEKVYSGFGTRIVGPISPHNVNEYHTGLNPVGFDPEKAKALLDEAGWKDSNGDGVRDKEIRGKRVEFEIEFMVSNSSKTAPRLAAMVAAEAKKIGLVINVNRIEFGTLTSKLKTHEFDMFGAGFNGSPLPKDLWQVWHSESWTNRGSNYFGFGNEYSDSLIETIRVTVDPDKRRPMYTAFQEMLQDWQPAIFIMAPQERIIIHKRFQGAKSTVVRPGYKLIELNSPKDKQLFGGEAG